MTCAFDDIIFVEKNHDIAAFEDIRLYERACRSATPALLLVPQKQTIQAHTLLSERLKFLPFNAHNETAYPGNRSVCAPPGTKNPSLAGTLGEYQPFHVDGSHIGGEWLADFIISYFNAEPDCGGELQLTTLDDLMDTLNGQEIHLLLNMTVEIERDLGARVSRYQGPLLTMRDRNTFAFRWRFDSTCRARCIDVDAIKQRDGEQLLKYIAAQLEIIPRTIVRTQPGLIAYITQFGAPTNVLLHGRRAGTAPQERLAKREWLNRVSKN